MLGPLLLLVLMCVLAATIPQIVTGWMASSLDQVLGWQTGQSLAELKSSGAPLSLLGYINAGTLIAITGGTLGFIVWARQAMRVNGPTWGCGYARPTVRMQYTGRSFAEILGERLLPRYLQPHSTTRAPQGLFPSKSEFQAELPDPVSEKVYEPFFRSWAERFSRLRVIQQGKLHVYLVYILVVVVLALAWVSVRAWWAGS
jgi:hypothetical protein